MHNVPHCSNSKLYTQSAALRVLTAGAFDGIISYVNRTAWRQTMVSGCGLIAVRVQAFFVFQQAFQYGCPLSRCASQLHTGRASS